MELARVGRLALMGELAASLAHEVNNPLGAMVTNASAGQRLLAHGEIGPTNCKSCWPISLRTVTARVKSSKASVTWCARVRRLMH